MRAICGALVSLPRPQRCNALKENYNYLTFQTNRFRFPLEKRNQRKAKHFVERTMVDDPKRNSGDDDHLSGYVGESTIRLMTRIAQENGAVNLSQGFPNEPPPLQVGTVCSSFTALHHLSICNRILPRVNH